MTVTFAGDLQVYSDEYSAIGPLRRPDMVDSTNSEEGSFGKNSTASNETLKFAHHSPQSLYDSFVPQHHQHHESTSTSASDSADSSPTTTVSVADDSSVTEMSPGSSPESPMAKIAIPLRPAGQPRPATSDEQRHTPPSGSFFDLQRPATPGKRPRNLKNLAVNTTGSLGMNRAASTPSLVAADTTTETLPPMQPVQVGSSRASSPPKSRRPSNLGLTIMTPANSKVFPPSVQLSIPPTPSFSRPNLLRHFQSSPSLPMYHQTQASDSILSAVESKRIHYKRSRRYRCRRLSEMSPTLTSHNPGRKSQKRIPMVRFAFLSLMLTCTWNHQPSRLGSTMSFSMLQAKSGTRFWAVQLLRRRRAI